MYCVCVFVC